MKIADFKRGQIYEMAVGHRSHVIDPYYVEIVEVGECYIVTNIPGKHELKINDSNWEYQTKRMSFVGMKDTHGHLLYNQKGLR